MEKYKKYIYPGLVLLIPLSLVIIFRTFLMTYIIEPVALLFWAAWRIVASVDQNIVWVALIIFSAVLLFLLIPTGKTEPTNSKYEYKHMPVNRVETWQWLIGDAVLGKSERERLDDHLRELVMAVVPEAQLDQVIESDDGSVQPMERLPDAAKQYLQPANVTNGTLANSNKEKIRYLLPKGLRTWASRYVYKEHAPIDEILNWMETELEIDNDR